MFKPMFPVQLQKYYCIIEKFEIIFISNTVCKINMPSMTPEIMVNYKKINKGFVGQCPKNPQFLVQTKSKSKIKVEIKEMIEDYVEIFPKERKAILPHGNNFRIILNEN